jgi:prepilin-type N-terminal cleavage/methylation domain-containing protein
MRRAFTLIELLICVAIVAVLISLLAPGLAAARGSARSARCAANLRALVTAWTIYANDSDSRAAPLAYWKHEHIGTGEQVFWFGSHGTRSTPPDPSRGVLAPYLDLRRLGPGTVAECPSQAWGSYRPQGPHRSPTTTYGYNGYYLSPEHTPGWGASIGHRPWRRLHELQRPSELAVFADALLPSGDAAAPPANTALLDPPMLYDSGSWRLNSFPTTGFRHGASTAGLGVADGSVRFKSGEKQSIRASGFFVGSVDTQPDPWYVPDWREWRAARHGGR